MPLCLNAWLSFHSTCIRRFDSYLTCWPNRNQNDSFFELFGPNYRHINNFKFVLSLIQSLSTNMENLHKASNRRSSIPQRIRNDDPRPHNDRLQISFFSLSSESSPQRLQDAPNGQQGDAYAGRKPQQCNYYLQPTPPSKFPMREEDYPHSPPRPQGVFPSTIQHRSSTNPSPFNPGPEHNGVPPRRNASQYTRRIAKVKITHGKFAMLTDADPTEQGAGHINCLDTCS